MDILARQLVGALRLVLGAERPSPSVPTAGAVHALELRGCDALGLGAPACEHVLFLDAVGDRVGLGVLAHLPARVQGAAELRLVRAPRAAPR